MIDLHRPAAFWALQAAGWGALAAIYGLASLPLVPPLQAFGGKLVLAGSGLALSLGLRSLYKFLRTRHGTGLLMATNIGLACYAGGLVWTNLEAWGLALAGLAAWPQSWRPSARGSLFYSTVLLAWSALYLVIVYARELEQRRQELEREREQALVSRTLAREAQLRALRYQLNPHFLFNTLNAISTLVAEGQGEAANATIARLAAFLRATLDEQQVEVPLERELALLDQYLAIERARLEDRLDVHIESDASVLDALVPALLLQPLVENAVRHGVAKRLEGGRVEVSAEPAGRRLRLVVRDDGPGATLQAPLGLGLTNTEERLRQLFGSDYALALRPSPAGGSELVVELPLRRAGALRDAS
jgi:two-component sensor histidine kinase